MIICFLQEQSDQGLHCLQFLLHFSTYFSVVKLNCSNFRIITANFWVSEYLDLYGKEMFPTFQMELQG